MPGFVSRSKRRSFVGKRSTPDSVVAEGAAAGIAKSGRSSNGQGGALSHTASWNGSLSPNGALRAGPAAVTCPYCLLEMLGAVPPRDYSYELFWVVFPLKTSTLTARFGAIARPLPYGRGSDQSRDRKGALAAGNSTISRGQRPS